MSEIVMPKNSAMDEELKAVLKIYSEKAAPGWMESSEYIPLLKQMIGDGQYASSYPKKAQVPSYYGLVEWKDKDNNKSPRRISERGRAFYKAWSADNHPAMHSIIMEALETTSFGRDNSGAPSSRSDVQPPCVCVRMILDLGGITINEFAYALWKLADKFEGYTDVIKEINQNRSGEITIDFSSLPNTYLDAKPLTFLKNIEFLNESDGQIVLNPAVLSEYKDRLKNLKIYVVDNNVFPCGPLAKNKGKQFSGSVVDKAECSRYLAAIRTKPFILLAGISGTGKSRMVRQLARGCCPKGHSLAASESKPGNYECIPVRPNWHDSTELMGYVSRISGKPEYVITDFVRFLAKAWLYEEEGIPFFLCLDEMNLAPVEQYFAEYLSVIETRKEDNGKIVTDTLVKISDPVLLESVIDTVYAKEEHAAVEKLKAYFKKSGGIPIPSNLIVMGTVNMDETTCTFSRKVLDRAMSFELNEVEDMYKPESIAGEGDYEYGSINPSSVKQTLVTGKDAYDMDNAKSEEVLKYLEKVNGKLNNTPFKIAYRSRNEIMIYCLERTSGGLVGLAQALDEATSMKILSRIEGDSQRVSEKWLGELSETIVAGLNAVGDYDESKCGTCVAKLADMKDQVSSGYTSFWMQ